MMISLPWRTGAFLYFLAVAILLNGCTATSMVPVSPSNPDRRSFQVRADADQQPAEAYAYRLVSGNPAIPVTDPRFQRVAGYVRAALSSRGLYEAVPGAKPEIEIAVTFDVSPPRVETRFTTVSTTQNIPETVQKVKEHVKLPDGTKQTVEKEVTIPAQSVTISTPVPYQVTLFLKELRLTATVPALAGGGRRIIWEVQVKNDDEISSIDISLPLLVAAAMDFLGIDLTEEKVVSLREKDARVVFVTTEPSS